MAPQAEYSKPKEEINKLEKTLSAELDKLTKLSDSDKKEKLKDIKEMINYYNNLTQQIEDRRNRIAELSWQNILIIIGLFTLLVSIELPNIYKFCAGLFLLYLLMPNLLKIREYYEQGSIRYPFLEIPSFSNKWKWFYYGNEFIPKISNNPFKINFENDKLNYLNGLNIFINNYTNETIDNELEDAIQQLYLLQVHNYYKNRFFLRLLDIEKKWNRKALIFILFLGLLLFIFAQLLSNYSPNAYQSFFSLLKPYKVLVEIF